MIQTDDIYIHRHRTYDESMSRENCSMGSILRRLTVFTWQSFGLGYQAAARLFCCPCRHEEEVQCLGCLSHSLIRRACSNLDGGADSGQCQPVSHRPNHCKARPRSGKDERHVRSRASGHMFTGSWVELGRGRSLSESPLHSRVQKETRRTRELKLLSSQETESGLQTLAPCFRGVLIRMLGNIYSLILTGGWHPVQFQGQESSTMDSVRYSVLSVFLFCHHQYAGFHPQKYSLMVARWLP